MSNPNEDDLLKKIFDKIEEIKAETSFTNYLLLFVLSILIVMFFILCSLI